MKFKKYIQEEFAGSKKLYSREASSFRDTEFFINPKSAEIKDAYKASGKEKCIRFFVNFKKKEVVIWEGSVMHIDAMEKFDSTIYNNKNLFVGSAKPGAGKMIILGSDSMEAKFMEPVTLKIIEDMLKHKKWLSKYFNNIDQFIEKVKAILRVM